jgi:hypothetical protein
MDDDLDADQHTLSLSYRTSPVWVDAVGAPASELNLAGNQDKTSILRRDWPQGR